MKMAALHDWHFFSSDSVFQGACVYGNEICKVLYIEAFVTKDLWTLYIVSIYPPTPKISI